MTVAHHRVGEQVVRPRWMMRGGSGVNPRATRTGHPEDGRRRGELRACERVERQIRGRREAPGRRDAGGAPERLAQHIGQSIAKTVHQRRGRMGTVMALMEAAILNPEIRGEIDDQAGPRFPHIRHDVRGLTVLQREKHHVRTPGRLGGGETGEARVGQQTETGMDLGNCLTGLTPAHRDQIIDRRVLEQEAEELPAHITRSADQGYPHGRPARTVSTSPAASRRALWAGNPSWPMM